MTADSIDLSPKPRWVFARLGTLAISATIVGGINL